MMTRILGLLLALASSVALAVPAAYVHALNGEARASTKGVSRVLQIGSILEQGDEVTVSKGIATLKFEDGQSVALQEGTRFRITDYQYNKSHVADSNVVLSLLSGGMRYITGVIGGTRRSAIRLQADTATIGIRGTDIISFVAADGSVLATVQEGTISFANAGVTAILTPGQGSISRANQAPGNGAPVTQLPPGSIIPVTPLGLVISPGNHPVDVTASAALVAAVADLAKKTRQLAAAEKALAEATAAERARAESELARAREAATAAALFAAEKVREETITNQQARLAALQGGAATDAGTSGPRQGTGVGLPSMPLPYDPATTPAAPSEASWEIEFAPPPTQTNRAVSPS